MKAVRFKTEGVFNSFRVPLFRTYHKSLLAPPKTTIIGMITNIMGKPEKWFYEILEKDIISVSVVIDSIGGRAKDLWTYKTLEKKGDMHGRSVIRRDRLFNAVYTIYLHIKDDQLHGDVLKALKSPGNVPSLGLDDEIVRIYDTQEVEMYPNQDKTVNSVFMDMGFKYTASALDISKMIEFPTSNIVPLKFSAGEASDGKRDRRIALEEHKQVEFINCNVEIVGVQSFTDAVNRVVFY